MKQKNCPFFLHEILSSSSTTSATYPEGATNELHLTSHTEVGFAVVSHKHGVLQEVTDSFQLGTFVPRTCTHGQRHVRDGTAIVDTRHTNTVRELRYLKERNDSVSLWSFINHFNQFQPIFLIVAHRLFTVAILCKWNDTTLHNIKIQKNQQKIKYKKKDI